MSLKRVPERLLKTAEVEAGLRWYTDEGHDLYVWLEKGGAISRFQFTYNKGTGREEVVEWKDGVLVGHALIDPGEDFAIHKRTPIIVANGTWSRTAAASAFEKSGAKIERGVFEFVREKIAPARRRSH